MSIKDISTISAPAVEATLLGRLLAVRKLIHLHAIHALQPLGLGPKQAALLRRLRLSGSSSCLVALAKATTSDPAAVGRTIDGLIRKGLVKPAPGTGKADRRRRHVALTPAGRGAADRVNAIFDRLDQAMGSALNADERRRFNALLDKLAARLA